MSIELEWLKKFESPNVTYMDDSGDWPIVWARANGCEVEDTSGKVYLDLTGAFGVAVTGHANAEVVAAGQNQMAKLCHAMGDVHPHGLKATLCKELSEWTFERWNTFSESSTTYHGRSIFCNSGFEAVEAALKSAYLYNGKKDIISFRGGYHGLGYGALKVTHREDFRSPFLAQIGGEGNWVRFPQTQDEYDIALSDIEQLIRTKEIGAMIVEPIQARGGIRVPPFGFLKSLKDICSANGIILIFDEIYTGFGRTGEWFACEHEKVNPDIICLGKALTGGFPLSVCVGRNDVMEKAWPTSSGEAIHTSTYLGHPVGCAMALAQLKYLTQMGALKQVREKGQYIAQTLTSIFSPDRFEVLGKGLMAGIQMRKSANSSKDIWNCVQKSLQAGYIFLPCGENGKVLSWTPPFIITPDQLLKSVEIAGKYLI